MKRSQAAAPRSPFQRWTLRALNFWNGNDYFVAVALDFHVTAFDRPGQRDDLLILPELRNSCLASAVLSYFLFVLADADPKSLPVIQSYLNIGSLCIGQIGAQFEVIFSIAQVKRRGGADIREKARGATTDLELFSGVTNCAVDLLLHPFQASEWVPFIMWSGGRIGQVCCHGRMGAGATTRGGSIRTAAAGRPDCDPQSQHNACNQGDQSYNSSLVIKPIHNLPPFGDLRGRSGGGGRGAARVWC